MQLLVITWGKLITRARVFNSNPAATVVLSAQGDQSVLITFNVFLHQSLRRNNLQHNDTRRIFYIVCIAAQYSPPQTVLTKLI